MNKRLNRFLTVIYIISIALYITSCKKDKLPIPRADSDIEIEGCIAEFLFNSNLNDETGNGNDGSGNVTYTFDRLYNKNQAAEFTGDNYMQIGIMSSLSTSMQKFSISFWMKSNTVGKSSYESLMKVINGVEEGMAVPVGMGSELIGVELHRGIDDSFQEGNIRLDVRDKDNAYLIFNTYNTEIFNNEWHHIVFVVEKLSEMNMSVYIDNTLQKSGFFKEGKPDSFNGFYIPFTIGAANNRGTIETFYTGAIDNLRFYSKALSVIEIEKLFNE